MIRKIHVSRICCLALFSLLACLFMFHPKAAHALSGSSFQAGDIIDDSVFSNSAAMKANDIQAFLNAKVPTCDTNGTQAYAGTTRAAYGASQGYPTPFTCLKDFTQAIPDTPADAYCGAVGSGTKSAAQIIAEVSAACKINPQVMIVLLQKEQGLVTDDWPWSIQYRSATGYGCPDSAACDADYYGFFNQVYNAAHQFQRYAAQPQLFNFRAGVTRTIAYNPNASCGGSSVYLQNQATASLYNYTPYQPNPAALTNLQGSGDSCSAFGNRNFWYYFNTWFGSPTGDLVRTATDASVYLVTDSTKYPISDGNILNDLYPLGPVRYVNDAYLGSLDTGPTVARMVRGPDGALYLVNAGIKLAFTDCAGDVIDYGYTCSQSTSQFINLTAQQINKLSSGPNVTKFMKSNADGTIYYVARGVKRPIPSWDDLLGLHVNQGINTFNDPLVRSLPTWYTIYKPGTLVKYPSSSSVYMVKDSDTALAITSFTYPQELGASTYTNTISGGYTTGTPVENKIQCSGVNYVGVNGTLYQLTPTLMTTFGFTQPQFINADNICPNLSTSSSPLSQYIRTQDGTIYFVSSGHKQAFGGYNTYQSASYCNNSCSLLNVSYYFAGSIPSTANL